MIGGRPTQQHLSRRMKTAIACDESVRLRVHVRHVGQVEFLVRIESGKGQMQTSQVLGYEASSIRRAQGSPCTH